MVDKVAFNFDPFELLGVEPPTTGRRALKQELAEYVLDQVLSHVEQGRSPVSAGKWKRSLSKEYRKRKVAQGGAGFADMELSGSMLDDLEVVNVRGRLELRVKGKNADKADGHNNHTGRSGLPPREFIPKDGGSFRRTILQGMREIINGSEPQD